MENKLNVMSTLGVIFTDTCVLADKYHCRRREVLEIIEAFTHASRYRGMDWQLVDVGGHDFDYIFNDDVTWQGYSRALADNCAGMGWKTDYNTPLLIIGGDDVIPMPIVPFPIQNFKGETELVKLQVDMFFCFPPDFDLRLEFQKFCGRKYNKGELYQYFLSKAVFNVSRLPLENGDMQTTVKHDLGIYFDRCSATGGYINVDSLLPTTAFQWYLSTQLTVEGLPLLPLGPSNGIHIGDFFTSPLLRLEDETTMSEYRSALSKAEMLLFNLHGSNDPDCPGFLGYGNDVLGVDQYGMAVFEVPLTFDISLLPQCKAKVFNTEACFGARYSGYRRSQSMLLSSLYHSEVLLYSGACAPSYYTMPIIKPDDNVNNLRLTNLVDAWLKIYLHMQMQGEPTGLAMLKSKLMYYDENAIDEDWQADYTIFEINQFGDPSLRIRAPRYNRVNATYAQRSITTNNEKERVVAVKEKLVSVYSKTVLPELDAAYADVHTSVDIALMRLSDDLRRMLSDDYHYPAQHLYLTAIMRDESSRGHLFIYSHDSRGECERGVYVRVDAFGQVKKITCKL